MTTYDSIWSTALAVHLVLVVIALLGVRKAAFDPLTGFLWTLFIVFVPVGGALASLIVNSHHGGSRMQTVETELPK